MGVVLITVRHRMDVLLSAEWTVLSLVVMVVIAMVVIAMVVVCCSLVETWVMMSTLLTSWQACYTRLSELISQTLILPTVAASNDLLVCLMLLTVTAHLQPVMSCPVCLMLLTVTALLQPVMPCPVCLTLLTVTAHLHPRAYGPILRIF